MSETITETIKVDRPPRSELVAALIVRDGLKCQHPDCGRTMSLDSTGPLEITIDHWIPQAHGFAEGWSYEEVWDLSNLKLMCKKCNAKKSDTLPNPDGTLPSRPTKTFRYRRDKRAQRAEICDQCLGGRNLGPDDWCNACGHGPQPGRYPKWRQMEVKQCDHDLFFCVSCTIWFPEQRRSVIDAIVTGGEGYE